MTTNPIYLHPVRWGILSSANIGVRAVAPAIQASHNGRLLAVGSRDPRHAAELYAFAPNVRIYDGYEQIIADPDIEAVYIPLPNALHAEWAIKAMEAGKHVLCEKPLAVTAEEGAQMVAVAQEQNVLLMEAFMYRFHPQIIWVVEQIRKGLIGDIHLVRASFSFDLRTHPENIRLNPELAGGSLMDVGCYAVNLFRAIYEQAPQSIAARVHTVSATSVDWATSAILDYGAGRFGLLDSSFSLPMRQVAEIFGESGTITLPVPFTPGNSDTTVFITRNGQLSEQTFSRVDQYQLQVEHFVDCIRAQKRLESSLNESLENLATIEGIYQAAGHDWPIF
ncbi:Gfo/Idh/MocA family protein [Tengunoibacter tsumagoiensis]|uniref:Oxidoreductase n=1 Tax=Tengunoibacter tsumagoiensis TaxID=2014871 RepID=A0A401ZZB5_9CHLR|nr:Gfo/Idh/MocA family oxidoreductase [Tengunoibacter tsumagoiensis]GCE12199.1 oxidoreductase [Tengunoibacter tsumagoiensis]